MFKKLRNKLILINLGITSVVVLIVFSAIYLISVHSANDRPPIIQSVSFTHSNSASPTDEVQQIVIDSLQVEKEAAAKQLLIMLIISGITIEIAVALVSYFLAEQSIKPIREAYDSQKIFIANASHEIKTPLAAISANLEAADIKNNKWIKNIERETEKLSVLNKELLSLARADLVTKSKIEEINLEKLVTKNIESFKPRLHNIEFNFESSAKGKVKLSTADFSQIFGILMDNAIKYCDKKIILKLTNHELTIANDGTIINKKDLTHIFDRFYQADKTSEGVGLGLSIAKTVADHNNWSIEAESTDYFTYFTLKF